MPTEVAELRRPPALLVTEGITESVAVDRKPDASDTMLDAATEAELSSDDRDAMSLLSRA